MDSSLSSVSDEELARRTQAGSRRSFEELIARYGRRLHCYLKPRIGSDQDVEDIVQETFLKLYRNIGSYDSRWKFSTWIYTAAGRLAISHYRARSHKKRLESEARSALRSSDEKPGDDLRANLWETAKILIPGQYQALWLRYVEGLSIKEIAEVMKKPSPAVRLLLHRARLKLAKLIGNGEAAAAAATGPTDASTSRFKENTG